MISVLRIGDFARRAGVTVRSLRHYEELGLLRPEWVDPDTGYRWYATYQVGTVNRLVALKELGFTLEQCRVLLDEQLSVEQLRGMLRLRRAEIQQRIASDTARLDEVAKRLTSIERGLTVTNSTLEFKPLPALRLAQVSAEVNDTVEIPTATRELFETLTARLESAGHPLEGRGIRTYYGRPDGSKIDVATGIPVGAAADPIDGLETVELDREEPAAAVVFRGPPDEIADAWYTFEVALEEHGLESYGVNRQLFIDAPDGADEWIVELQCPVRDRGSGCAG